MIKKRLLVGTLCTFAMLVVVAVIYAEAVPDVIVLQDQASEQKKGPVEFNHVKHQTEYAKEYPDVYKKGCGECHHDKDGKALTNLKAGDEVQKCIECHKKPGERPKGKDAPKLSKKERMEYNAEAFHENCKDCHKKYNKKYKPSKDKKAPTTCTKCHQKK